MSLGPGEEEIEHRKDYLGVSGGDGRTWPTRQNQLFVGRVGEFDEPGGLLKPH